MAEAQQYTFTYKELVELMLRAQGITQGIWALYVRFGLGAANMGPNPESLQPAAIIPLLEIGLQKSDELTNVSVDAAELTKKAKKA